VGPSLASCCTPTHEAPFTSSATGTLSSGCSSCFCVTRRTHQHPTVLLVIAYSLDALLDPCHLPDFPDIRMLLAAPTNTVSAMFLVMSASRWCFCGSAELFLSCLSVRYVHRREHECSLSLALVLDDVRMWWSSASYRCFLRLTRR